MWFWWFSRQRRKKPQQQHEMTFLSVMLLYMTFVFSRSATALLSSRSLCHRSPIALPTRHLSRKKDDDEIIFMDHVDLSGWMTMDRTWINGKQSNSSRKSTGSKVECRLVRDRLVYVKRDDMLHLPDSYISGNKARKLLPLNDLPVDDFPQIVVSYGGPQSNAMLALAAVVYSKNHPQTDLHQDEEENDSFPSLEEWDATQEEVVDETYKRVQQKLSNNYHNSQQTDEKNIRRRHKFPINQKMRFIYYTKKLPRYLRKQPNGNLLRALSLGMELQELSHAQYQDFFGNGAPSPPYSLLPPPSLTSPPLWVPQGAACTLAIPGAKQLAMEIIEFWQGQLRKQFNSEITPISLAVCIPAGTCTTATFTSLELHRLLQQQQSPIMDIQVVIIPCIGDAVYAEKQMMNLFQQYKSFYQDDGNVDEYCREEHLPKILEPITKYASKKKFIFGEPCKELWDTYCEMKEQHDVHIDLLYGAPAWNILLQHISKLQQEIVFSNNDNEDNYEQTTSPIDGRRIMYVHSGGLEGIASQMTRYVHKGIIDPKQMQS